MERKGIQISFVADVHIGNHRNHGGRMNASVNDRCTAAIQALERAVQASKDSEMFIIGGDLFHYAKIEPQVLAQTMKALQGIAGSARLVVLVGNHDQHSDAPGDNACAPLMCLGDVVDSEPQVFLAGNVQVVVLPFSSGPASEWIPEMLATIPPRPPHVASRVLCFHVGVSDSETPYFLDGNDDSISIAELTPIVDKFRFDYVLAGNWHRREMWRLDHASGRTTIVVQAGTLAPARFCDDVESLELEHGELGQGSVVHVCPDPENAPMFPDFPGVYVDEVPGPRFIRLNGPDALTKFAQEKLVDGSYRRQYGAAPLFLSVRVPAVWYQTTLERIRELPEGVYGEVVADRELIKKDTDEQVQSVSTDANVQDVIARYVDKCPFDQELDRAQVKNLVLGYLKEARTL